MVEKVTKIKIFEGQLDSLDQLKGIVSQVTQTYGAWPVVEGELKLSVVQQNYWDEENFVSLPGESEEDQVKRKKKQFNIEDRPAPPPPTPKPPVVSQPGPQSPPKSE